MWACVCSTRTKHVLMAYCGSVSVVLQEVMRRRATLKDRAKFQVIAAKEPVTAYEVIGVVGVLMHKDSEYL